MHSEKALRWAINIAALVVLMDLSAVNIALPQMRAYFGTSVSLISLVLMISMLTASSSALIMGKISQLVSPKKVLLLGFAFFGLTTLLSGLMHHFVALLVLRFLQGFAEAALYVIGPALIKRYLHPDKQATAYGQWMMSTGIGISVGPLIGGYLINLFSWSAVFFINIPLILMGLIFSLQLKIPKTSQVKEVFDWWGAMWSFVFLAALIAAVNLAKTKFGQEDVVVLLVLSLLAFVAFIYREKHFSFPVLQLDLLRIRNFWLSSLGFFLFFVVNVGSRFLRPFYFEEGRGFGSELSGWLMFISPAVMVLLSPFTAYFQKILGTKTVVLFGNFFLFLSMFMFSFWDADRSLFFVGASMFFLGIGMGLFYPATTTLGMQALPAQAYGMGSATISTAKSMGKLIGVLLFAVLFTEFVSWFNVLSGEVLPDEKIAATQNVFRVAAGLSLLAFVFSLGFKKSR